MNATENFSRLWDGSERGWIVVRHTEDRETLRVVFAGGAPTMSEVKSLRAAIPAFAERPAGEVLSSLKGLPEFELGEFESSAARAIRMQCEALGLRVASQGHQLRSYSLVNELSKTILLIEDDATRDGIAEEAIKQGLPIRHSVV